MKHIFLLFLLCATALFFSACHCKTCSVNLPGANCAPCPKPPKPLKPPRCKPECHYPIWCSRPVKCVATQVMRKCCHCEKACTEEGYEYQIEVCEITYKSLYSDGSTRVWSEVRRNPVKNGPNRIGPNIKNYSQRTSPLPGSLVKRCP